ncbi:MAG TPA: M12 family metallo-peptidase [Chitinophagaceae bacterium]|nr:M12 family metallo-peptidase [Chitinophagaceae bacterium]
MKKLLICLLALSGWTVEAQQNIWTFSDETVLNVPGSRKIIPDHYQLAHLNAAAFKLQQAFIPSDANGGADILLPTPTGSMEAFRIFEYPMMDEALSHKYPFIKTYTAIQKTNPAVMAKIDYTLFGFHAMVMNGDETYFIDPYSDLSDEWYVVYYKKEYRKPNGAYMHCEVDELADELQLKPQAISLSDELPVLSSYKTNGDTLRNYRLALACTEEYSAAVGGSTPTKASVLSAMVTSMNRVNGVFEKDFSMHANLVANDDTLIFLPGSGDPYTNGSGSTMLGENQTTCNNRIGSANYDFGHVFSTGGGGVAQKGCVCGSSKARGVTGSSNPVGDPYDIDYVAHEMGHQFGGDHTFNSVSGSCSGNRVSASAFEIGSATTIMGYAGICSGDDIQPHSDDYYHVRSLEQMTGSTVNACATKTVSGNTPPVLAAMGKTYIIPYKTDFELSISATDAQGDPLTYCWEEYDKGGSGSAWDAATTVAPILRSFNPSVSGTRVFPQYRELIKNTVKYLGERLPDTNRIVRFRCTVRDLHNGHGSFTTSTDTTKLDVRKTTTLFRVNSQNTVGQQWMGFSTQTITWDVAGTNAAPFNTANVDIYLSTDSGKTFTFPLVLNTPNDGSETIGVPNVDAPWARVKVKASDNVYFDLNDEWIQLKKVVSPAGLSGNYSITFAMYPNPAAGYVIFEMAEEGEMNLNDVSGRTLLTSRLHSGTQQINLQGLASGVYLVNVNTMDGRKSSAKLVVK